MEATRFLHANACPKCAEIIGTKRLEDFVFETKSNEYIKDRIKELFQDEYQLVGDYIGSDHPITIRHTICNEEFTISRTNNFLKDYGTRCPYCKEKGTSKFDKEFYQFIKSFYTGKIVVYDKTILNGKELDIYIPDKKIAFELNGLLYHSEDYAKRCDKNYHLSKTLACQEKGIRLIHIFEDEWAKNNTKRNITKSKVKHILGCNECEKIYARNCTISVITKEHKNQFLRENHIQGEDRSTIMLGLWYPISDEEDRLVSVMTFSKLRNILGNKDIGNENYELVRFANDIEFQVIGSFGKLFSYFKRNYNFNQIITYADRRWSIGTIYEKNGFTFDHYSKPSYWYCLHLNRLHRSNFQKHILKEKFPEYYDDSLTESEIMSKTKYRRIWDCGQMIYTFDNA